MLILLTGCYLGLGKTAQAITAARQTKGHVVVICPASAVPNWHAEWDLWAPGTRHPDVISYSSLIRRNWQSLKPGLTILDEAHYAKTPSAKRTRAALGVARRSERAYLLSGTPMPNNPTEIYAPLKALWPELVAGAGCRTAFEWMMHFCHVRETLYGPKPYAVKNGAELRALLAKVMLRRSLGDVGLELPSLRVDLFRLPPTKALTAALSAYDELTTVDPDDPAPLTSTVRRVLGEAKAAPVAKLIAEELQDRAYNKVVVLYHHRSVRDILRDTFLKGGISLTGFGGETSQANRALAIRQFQEEPQIRVFLAQQQAAGIAINLTAASEVALVEPAWSPEDNRQAIMRVHRIGQDRPCRARIFAVSGTIDEAVLSTVRNKVKMQLEVGL